MALTTEQVTALAEVKERLQTPEHEAQQRRIEAERLWEAVRREAAEPLFYRYNRGLLTVHELAAELAVL